MRRVVMVLVMTGSFRGPARNKRRRRRRRVKQCERGRRTKESRGGDVRGRRESQRRGNTQSAQWVQEGEEGRGWADGLTWGGRARKKVTGVEVQGRVVLLQFVRRGCWMPWTTAGAEASGGGGGGSGSGSSSGSSRSRHRLGSGGGMCGREGGPRREKRYEGGSLWRRAVEVQQAGRGTTKQEAGRSRIAAVELSTEESWVTDGSVGAVQRGLDWPAGGGLRAAGWLGALAQTRQTKAGLTTFRLESVSWLECRPLAALVCSVQRPNVGSSQSRDALDPGGAQLTSTPDLACSCCRFAPPASSRGGGGLIAVAECSKQSGCG